MQKTLDKVLVNYPFAEWFKALGEKSLLEVIAYNLYVLWISFILILIKPRDLIIYVSQYQLI